MSEMTIRIQAPEGFFYYEADVAGMVGKPFFERPGGREIGVIVGAAPVVLEDEVELRCREADLRVRIDDPAWARAVANTPSVSISPHVAG